MTGFDATERGAKGEKYRFIAAATLYALEEELDRLVREEPGLKLIQVLYAAGTGFVGVIERHDCAGSPAHDAAHPVKPERSDHKKRAPDQSG